MLKKSEVKRKIKEIGNIIMEDKRARMLSCNSELEKDKEKIKDLNRELEIEKEKNKNLNKELEIEKEKNKDLNIELEKEKEINKDLYNELEIEKEKNKNLNKELEIENENNEDLNKELEIEKEKNNDLNEKLEDAGIRENSLLEQITLYDTQKTYFSNKFIKLEDWNNSLIEEGENLLLTVQKMSISKKEEPPSEKLNITNEQSIGYYEFVDGQSKSQSYTCNPETNQTTVVDPKNRVSLTKLHIMIPEDWEK